MIVAYHFFVDFASFFISIYAFLEEYFINPIIAGAPLQLTGFNVIAD
jgi:hypothetical protein